MYTLVVYYCYVVNHLIPHNITILESPESYVSASPASGDRCDRLFWSNGLDIARQKSV